MRIFASQKSLCREQTYYIILAFCFIGLMIQGHKASSVGTNADVAVSSMFGFDELSKRKLSH